MNGTVLIGGAPPLWSATKNIPLSRAGSKVLALPFDFDEAFGDFNAFGELGEWLSVGRRSGELPARACRRPECGSGFVSNNSKPGVMVFRSMRRVGSSFGGGSSLAAFAASRLGIYDSG